MAENSIASQIKRLRKKRGWTQPQLADKLNVSKQTVSNWETGIKVPRMNSLQNLADLFNVKVGEITNASLDKRHLMMTIGTTLKNLRLNRKRTQEEVAKALKISRASYSHFETGRNNPDYDTLIKLADYYHVSTDYLLGHSISNKQTHSNHTKNIETITQIFSNNLNKLMDSRGENLSQLSDRIGVAYSTVSDWKHGKKMPRPLMLQKLANHYNVDVSNLTNNKFSISTMPSTKIENFDTHQNRENNDISKLMLLIQEQNNKLDTIIDLLKEI